MAAFIRSWLTPLDDDHEALEVGPGWLSLDRRGRALGVPGEAVVRLRVSPRGIEAYLVVGGGSGWTVRTLVHDDELDLGGARLRVGFERGEAPVQWVAETSWAGRVPLRGACSMGGGPGDRLRLPGAPAGMLELRTGELQVELVNRFPLVVDGAWVSMGERWATRGGQDIRLPADGDLGWIAQELELSPGDWKRQGIWRLPELDALRVVTPSMTIIPIVSVGVVVCPRDPALPRDLLLIRNAEHHGHISPRQGRSDLLKVYYEPRFVPDAVREVWLANEAADACQALMQPSDGSNPHAFVSDLTLARDIHGRKGLIRASAAEGDWAPNLPKINKSLQRLRDQLGEQGVDRDHFVHKIASTATAPGGARLLVWRGALLRVIT
jgi:hypothetical protein